MILSCSHISKAFVDKPVLVDGSFHIEEREKAAIVGINGAGKSTLLKIITGDLKQDEGDVFLAKDKRLGYLAQHQELDTTRTIFGELLNTKKDVLALEEQIRSLEQQMQHLSGEELESALARYTRMNHQFEQENGYALKSEIIGVLKGLGFDESEFEKPIHTLSGGQKTRVALGRLLLSRPDILLLDEPTNHLDLNSIAWLETFLLNYSGSVIIVSHDRYFMDKIVTKIIEVENTRLSVYQGNYSDYSQKKKAVRESQLKAWMNQQQEIRHQEEVITKLRSFNREKSIRRAESREKLLDKMVRLEKPIELDASMRLHLEPAVTSGNDVLEVSGLSKQFGSQVLFSDASFSVKRGEKVAIIGNNGTGKTTLLKIINGMLEADGGECRLGSRVMIGYYDQEQQVLHMENNLFEEISDAHPQMTNTEIRNLLAAFLFTGDDVFKPVRALSGGEKGRVSLALLMLSDANFLILDEPTNHLDMISREILEQTIRDYSGTLLYVSHDRYFINQTATRILELTNQTFVNYIGNYDYYLEKKDILAPAAPDPIQAASSAAPVSRQNWQTQKEAAARQRKLENDCKKAEANIARLEEKKETIEASLSDGTISSNAARLMELHRDLEAVEQELSRLYELWETLAEQLS
ncbi:MAG: ABC-F family ATP-binding cassette domain-containing protein [Lachnospiraceae bacterium]|nr:ABC-F family ATP-binding cassette domain-containing protein [Lachnospiraceae bacterium]